MSYFVGWQRMIHFAGCAPWEAIVKCDNEAAAWIELAKLPEPDDPDVGQSLVVLKEGASPDGRAELAA